MGYVAIAYTSGILVAPLVGGVIYGNAGYYAVYALSFAMIGIDAICRLIIIEKSKAEKWTGTPDVPLDAIAERRASKTDDDVPVPARRSDESHHENVHPEGSTPRRKSKVPPMLLLLKSRRLLTAWWATFAAGVIFASFDTTLPLFVHRVFGWNSTGGGLIFLTVSIPSFAGPIVGTSLAFSDNVFDDSSQLISS